jgi:hypothetical protein
MKRAVVAFAVALVMLLAVLWSNKGLVGSMSFVPQIDDPEKIDKYSHYLEALLTSVDQLVSMLVTVQLSLFVFAGFALNKRLRETRVASATLVILGGIFLLSALISLTLGYTARIQALTLIQLGTWRFESVQATLVHQSIFLVLSAVAAVCMMLVALLDRNAVIREADDRVHRVVLPPRT